VVSKNYKCTKPAFTLIELIFAIVIISIAVMSLPMMTRITSKGVESNIVQEAIFAASAEIMNATSGYWDDNSMQDIDKSYLSRVINIAGDCDNNRLRPGHIAQPLHRRCLDDNTTTANDNGVKNIVYDLNDAAQTYDLFKLDTTNDSAGYKQSYTITIDVHRINNTKFIEATVKDKASNKKVVVLKAQSANVGEIDYYKRRF